MSRTQLQDQFTAAAVLTPGKREEIVRRYWLRGELTPLAVANRLAGQRIPEPA